MILVLLSIEHEQSSSLFALFAHKCYVLESSDTHLTVGSGSQASTRVKTTGVLKALGLRQDLFESPAGVSSFDCSFGYNASPSAMSSCQSMLLCGYLLINFD
jgi:hypothetical protein